jgi:hypothetical protein
MMNFRRFIVICFVLISFLLQAQEEAEVSGPGLIGSLPEAVIVPSLASQLMNGTFKGVDPNAPERLGQPKRHGANMTVPGKGLPLTNDALVRDPDSYARHKGKSPQLVFNANTSTYTPSDPTGAVGPNHFIGAWNVGFRIFDKQGNPLTPPASLSSLFPGNNLGDPIVLYDVQADRFIITEFDSSPNGFNVAICQGPDPVNDGWFVYTTGFTTGTFPDYPKFSIWSDGYYVTANINNNNRLFVIQRDVALQGGAAKFLGFPLPGIRTSGFYSPQVFNVTNGNLPARGNATVVYMQDDAWTGVTQDHLKLWTVNVNWDTLTNSSISAALQLNTTPFISVFDGGSFSNRPQPSGPDQDVLQATIMNQAQFRKFPTHNSVVFNFVVDTDASPGELAGIRWYELRQNGDGQPWYIFQEGTYTSPNNGKDAFSGSMAMDKYGNIGMAYTTVSSTERIAIYYTGRYASDPPGLMTVDETLIAQSTSNNPSNRLADYVHLTVDPVNETTFWHIAEYFIGARTDVVGVFKLAPDFLYDVSLMTIDQPVDGALTDSETVTVTLFNAGLNDLYNIPISFQLDDGVFVTEIITDTIASANYFQYSFDAKANMSEEGKTYSLKVFAGLESDEYQLNDTVVRQVRHLVQKDIGVLAFVHPSSGILTLAPEAVEVKIKNFGLAAQTGFPMSYQLENQTISEVFADTIQSGQTLNYVFQQPAVFTSIGDFQLAAFTSLSEDFYPENDSAFLTVTKTLCAPSSNCAFGLALQKVEIGSIINNSSCSQGGYGDFKYLSTELERNTLHTITVGTGYGDMFVRVWIDFNDNFLFEDNEVVVANFKLGENQGSGTHIAAIPMNIPENAPLGNHVMRVKANWFQPVPDNACDVTQYGETEDYMVNITLYTGLESELQQNAQLLVTPFSNKQYQVSLSGKDVTGTMLFNLFNTKGQKLVENRIDPINGVYTYPLDMSYATPGVYLVRIGNARFGKTQRIVVQ